MGKRLDDQLAFLLRTDKMKEIGRQTYLADGTRKENDAEHSFHLALMASILHEYCEEEVDRLRTMEMLLVHDIVEIEAGDTYVLTILRETKARRSVSGWLQTIYSVFFRMTKQYITGGFGTSSSPGRRRRQDLQILWTSFSQSF